MHQCTNYLFSIFLHSYFLFFVPEHWTSTYLFLASFPLLKMFLLGITFNFISTLPVQFLIIFHIQLWHSFHQESLILLKPATCNTTIIYVITLFYSLWKSNYVLSLIINCELTEGRDHDHPSLSLCCLNNSWPIISIQFMFVELNEIIYREIWQHFKDFSSGI